MLSAAASVRRGVSSISRLSSIMSRAEASPNLQPHGAVIAAHHFGRNPRTLDCRAEFRAGDEIIDPPPDVSRAAVHHLTPPCVMTGAFFEFAKRVHESGLEQAREVRPLLIRES